MSSVVLDAERLADIAARMDLREPNREAVASLAMRLSQHYDVDGLSTPFEAIIDSATGVGKTYVMAAAIEYLVAANGIRNFAIIAPGRTILDKTVANFSEGHPKSLLGVMESRPVVITAENFNTPTMRVAMDDDSQVKLFIFTVQSLTAPGSKQGRKTHTFQEGLGEAFYTHLAEVEDLVVLADEHHTYYGPAFSKAIRNLDPHALVGLTATPHAKTPKEQVIFRYPLAAAIADRLVKTPVIVGRRDDRTDATTKLSDGLVLLRSKAKLATAYAMENHLPPVKPVMLVIAKDIAEADEYGAILASGELDPELSSEDVLVVTSKSADEALAKLAAVEEPDSRVRVIISVGMLKEGWDVKNVYVIASMRASVSTILTEQTLGRGLRLPWGSYTDVELLDTLEVVAHERYEDLLKRAGVLNESFIDTRTQAVLRENSAGDTVAVIETTTVSVPVVEGPLAGTALDSGGGVAPTATVLMSVEERTARVEEDSDLALSQEYRPRDGMPQIAVPRLVMQPVRASFSLNDITNLVPFQELGRKMAKNPETELRRMKISARVVTGPDGMRRTELVTTTAVDKIYAPSALLPLNQSRVALAEAVLAAPVVPARKKERAAVAPLLDAFLEGLGPDAEELLSAYFDRAAARLISLVTDEQRRYATRPLYNEVVDLVSLNATRISARKVSNDRTGKFSKNVAYNNWTRSLYPVDWFDSEPERAVANIVDDDDAVLCWVRLHINELPILWRSDGRKYNPDLIVVETDGTHWVVEIKMDRDIASEEVLAKRNAAQRWANNVNTDEKVDVQWRYLLASETDIRAATGSWTALKGLGS